MKLGTYRAMDMENESRAESSTNAMNDDDNGGNVHAWGDD
jgi:hypothetical protein